jgi:putative transposase
MIIVSELGWGNRQFGHRARLALTPAQVDALDEQGYAGVTVWNCLHALWSMTPKCQRSVSRMDAAIRQARKEVDFLAPLPAQASQAVLKTYMRAWKNCWEGRAEAPTFKKKYRVALSVDVPQGRDLHVKRVHRRWGMVNIPKVGRVRFHWTKHLPVGKIASKDNRITGARLVKDALGWNIAFRITTLEPKPQRHTGPEAGIDPGVVVPLALSDGNHQDHGRPHKLPDGTADRDKWLNLDEKTKLHHLERTVAHKKSFHTKGEKSSQALRGAYRQIHTLRAKAKRRHMDWQHKTTTVLAGTYSVLAVEGSRVSQMTRSARGTITEPGKNVAAKAGLNRSLLQEAWYRTYTMLAYKAAQRGGTVVRVHAPNSSKRCHVCGFVTDGNREDQATFACKNATCRWKGNADLNAARNHLHSYRIGHLVEIPAAGRAVVRRAKRVKPAAAR